MALSALQASQLSTLLAGHAKMFTANNPGQNEFADYLLKSGQSATMGLLAEEEEKKRKKAEKGGLLGKLGAAAGTAAGIALAPVTGGASLAAAGAIGGGLGGLAGQYLGGGSPTLGSFAMDAAQGGLSGYTFGKAGDLASNVQTSGVTTDMPGSPPIGQKITDGIANAIPNANTLSMPPLAAAYGQGQGVFPQDMVQNMPPMANGMSSLASQQNLKANPGFNEPAFQNWYKGWASKTGIDPNPDDPNHKYDYRAAYSGGAVPQPSPEDNGRYHWPSQYKADDHPNRFVEINGVRTDTKNNVPAPLATPGVAGVPQAAQRTRPSFFGALNHVMNPQAQRPQGRLIRKLPDGTEIYE